MNRPVYVAQLNDPRIWGQGGGLKEGTGGQRIHQFVDDSRVVESEMFRMMEGAGLATDILAGRVNYLTIAGGP